VWVLRSIFKGVQICSNMDYEYEVPVRKLEPAIPSGHHYNNPDCGGVKAWRDLESWGVPGDCNEGGGPGWVHMEDDRVVCSSFNSSTITPQRPHRPLSRFHFFFFFFRLIICKKTFNVVSIDRRNEFKPPQDADGITRPRHLK